MMRIFTLLVAVTAFWISAREEVFCQETSEIEEIVRPAPKLNRAAGKREDVAPVVVRFWEA